MGRAALPVPTSHCKQCGATMTRKTFSGRLEDRSVFMRRKFCDQSCMAKWQEGRIKVPSPAAGRRQANKAMQPACERCSSTKALHVHHRDENPMNNLAANLQTLCASCHRLSHSPYFDATTGRRKPCAHCDKPARKLGLCWTHLTRQKRYGDPLMTKVREGSSWVLVRRA
jgi:hypothetical protein